MSDLTHLGLIIDGNRRWAKQHGKTQQQGHEAGYAKIQPIAAQAFALGITTVSFYLFSTENWGRTKQEVRGIFKLLTRIITATLPFYETNGVSLVHVGREDRMPKTLVTLLKKAEAETKGATKTLNLCIDYGARDEIVQNLQAVEKRPALDLVIRTSGEQRLSNFMLWEGAYSELVFLDKYWPDFTAGDLKRVVGEYEARQRRFGV